jgi:hypothetical protein
MKSVEAIVAPAARAAAAKLAPALASVSARALSAMNRTGNAAVFSAFSADAGGCCVANASGEIALTSRCSSHS